MYVIKNLKNFKGHEGEPLAQGTLHGPLGKAADWSDDYSGGPFRLDFIDKKAEEAVLVWAKGYLPDKQDYDGKNFDPATMTRNDILESAVQHLSYATQEEQTARKLCKKGIVYRVKDAASPGGVATYSSKWAYTPENVTKLRAAEPQLVDILNETYGLPFEDQDTVNKAAENKRLKALCRTATIFILRKPDGTSATMKHGRPYSALVAADLRRQHKDALQEIVNERFL